MSILTKQRLSDSPYIERIMHGITTGEGAPIRPAETNWHMVFVKVGGIRQLLVVGPWTTAGTVRYGEGAEILWLKFKLGTFMPHLPVKNLLDRETIIPQAADKKFWLNSSVWQFPDFENADTFVNRLAHQEILLHDPVVSAALQDQPQEIAARTLRHRFLHATGTTRNHIYQVERARRAAALLEQGMAILDVVAELNYFDQPHLTRALKQWVGYTPAQIIQMSKPDYQIITL
jgi:AraC-like DNA-binding protein